MYVVDRSIHKLFLKVEGLKGLGVRSKKTSALLDHHRRNVYEYIAPQPLVD